MSAGDHAVRVVATAGHVDHGKSSLILRLTGMDPDRWDEEKRRGLTIDLGYAWCELPSGREIGFVDVPGHERFIHNMLAGVGPVRLVLFVVAADEGWKPQSEEHLSILSVLGVHGAVIALTKSDLVDPRTLARASEAVRDRVAKTPLGSAVVVPCSSQTGEGIDTLRGAIDEMVAGAPEPWPRGRPRLFVDRVFSIVGAGTVVTGTLSGECLSVGDDVEIYPTGARARIRGLQTHKRATERACPVSRVAANLVGVDREGLERGQVLAFPGWWRATRTFEARLWRVRGLDHSVGARGAFKLYAGSAEVDARIRLYDAKEVDPAGGAFARIRTSAPLVFEVHDRFVLRDAGRRQTVAGGEVLDIDPPARPGADAATRLSRREEATATQLPGILVEERGAVRARDALLLTGDPGAARSAALVGSWLVGEPLKRHAMEAAIAGLEAFHAANPLREGDDLNHVRAAVGDALLRARVPDERGLIDDLIADMESRGLIARDAATVRLAAHRVSLVGREEEIRRLRDAVGRSPQRPPTVPELLADGFSADVIEAAANTDLIVRISHELVFDPALVRRAERLLREAGDGITVSAFREALGTTRKYALPLLEWFDEQGVTRREGDLRFPR